uniref:YDG domain-containing protein n=1 Tax=Noviherbaspirillum soli TaxID=1064518 RepID=UPI001E49444F
GIGTLNRTVAGDKVTASASGAAFADKTAATNKEVTVSGVVLAGDDAANYTIAGTVKTTASIARRALTLSDTKVDDREYDGTKDATLNGIGTLNRTVAGDKVTASASGAAFADKAAATNKEVTVSGVALAGDDAANYTIAGTVKTTASITRRALTLSDTKVDDREYDGTSNAALNGIGTLNRTVAGDKVTASASGAAFADKTAATNKEVTVSGVVLAGDDAANYTIAGTVKTTASIARRALTLSDTKVDDREYDGTKDATLNGIGTLNRTVAGDKVTASASGAAFADKAAATNKEVTVSGVALAGDDAANYTIAGTVKTTASIRPRPLAVRAQGVDKVYDGNTNASITLGDNRIEGDRLDLRYAKASFADSNAGSGKPVTVAGIAASGVDAGNYMADSNVVTTASIGRAPLTVAANPDSKTFDGKAYRGGNGVSFSGFVAGENVGVLGGQLGYGGNAQGAVEMGSYRILPGGYASQNYAIVYVDGKLTIEAPAVQPANQPGGSLTGATVAALNEIRSMEQAGAMSGDTRPLLSRPTLSIDRCGVRIPRRVLNVMEGDCLAAALQPAAARAVASTRLAGN